MQTCSMKHLSVTERGIILLKRFPYDVWSRLCLIGDKCGSVRLFHTVCSSSLPLPPLCWGRGIASRADRPIFQMYVTAPLKGCSLVLYTMWFSLALQDSRRGGGGGGGVCTAQILFSPPIVCVQ